MGYCAKCDVCGKITEVNPDGDLPDRWGTLMVEFFPEVEKMDPESVDPEVKKGRCIKIITCDDCTEIVEARGMGGIGKQLAQEFSIILRPTGA